LVEQGTFNPKVAGSIPARPISTSAAIESGDRIDPAIGAIILNMARKLLAGVVIAVATGFVAPAAGAQAPILHSAAVLHRHVVVQISTGDLRPVLLSVATRPAVSADGELVKKNVRLRETIQLPSSATGVARWESRGTLAPGTYFVQVEAFETGGLTDCPRFLPNCNARWSNIRRVVVQPSS
jgi:hypothetical protein